MKKILTLSIALFFMSPFVKAQKLLDAVASKNYEAVKKYIKDGENVNKANKRGQFPLWNAVWNEDAQMVSLLLQNGANPVQKFKGKDSELGCLEIAAQQGYLDIVQLLVAAGADINVRSFRGHTPLRIAARNGRVDVVNYCLSKGAEVNTQGEDGATPLEHAASKGHLEIVKLLVEKGANINLQDKEGDFALGEAAKAGFMEVVVYLLEKGADASLKNQDGNTAQQMAWLAGQPKVEAYLKSFKRG